MPTILSAFQSLRITRKYKGYRHTLYALELILEDETRLEAVTKEIYMPTAKHFGCDWTAVERNIRTVILYVWKTNRQALIQMAGYSMDAPPAVTEFLEIVLNYIQRNPLPLG